MVLKGGVLENKRGEEKEIRSFFFFEREKNRKSWRYLL
jgi:hypothetical protein